MCHRIFGGMGGKVGAPGKKLKNGQQDYSWKNELLYFQ